MYIVNAMCVCVCVCVCVRACVCACASVCACVYQRPDLERVKRVDVAVGKELKRVQLYLGELGTEIRVPLCVRVFTRGPTWRG